MGTVFAIAGIGVLVGLAVITTVNEWKQPPTSPMFSDTGELPRPTKREMRAMWRALRNHPDVVLYRQTDKLALEGE